MYYKSISAKLCPPVSGQCVMDIVVNSPQKGDHSYELFMAERNVVLSQLDEKVGKGIMYYCCSCIIVTRYCIYICVVCFVYDVTFMLTIIQLFIFSYSNIDNNSGVPCTV